MPIFECPSEHQEGLEAVKEALGIRHHYLDNWIYHFFKNKAYNIKETISKLHRRDDMEKTVFLNYEVTPFIKESMRSGAVQYIGCDREGRPILYFNTALNKADARRRQELQANLDMFLSWALRCNPLNPLSQVIWLINQKNASLIRNTDLIFQKDMAFRVSKFFPGMVARLYVCNMNFALTFVVQPLVKHLPKALSNSIHIFSGSDIRNGKLLQYIDAEVLPVSLGGMNACETKENYETFATTVESFFKQCIHALRQGISIKQMEMMEAFSVDKDGHPLLPKNNTMLTEEHDYSLSLVPQPARNLSLDNSAARCTKEMDEERLNDGLTIASRKSSPNCQHAPTVLLAGKHTEDNAFNEISSFLDTNEYDRAQQNVSSQFNAHADDKYGVNNESLSFSTTPSLLRDTSLRSPLLLLGTHHLVANSSSMSLHENSEAILDEELTNSSDLAVLDIQGVDILSFRKRLPGMLLSLEEMCELEKNWTRFRCYSIDLAPLLLQFIEELCHSPVPAARLEPLDLSLLIQVAHHILDLFPQTTQPLHFPLLLHFTKKFGIARRLAQSSRRVQPLDCSSPDNFLISFEASVSALLGECETLLGGDAINERVLRRLLLRWPHDTSQSEMLIELKWSARNRWMQLVPFFQKYIETKVSIAIAEFLVHYGLLIVDGKVDPESEWYTTLHSNLVQYHELHRQQWLFYVFPPPFLDEPRGTDGPTLAEILVSHHQKESFRSLGKFILLIEKRFQAEMEVLSPTSLISGASRIIVERYLEDTHEKIRIPYNAQNKGYTPQEFIKSQQAIARELLEKSERVLEEFLLISAGIFILERITEPTATNFHTEEFIAHEFAFKEVTRLRKELTDSISSVKSVRSVLMCLAQLAYDFQGTFGVCDLSIPEDLFDCTLDGYALTYILFFIVACIQLNHQRPFPFTNSSLNSQRQPSTEDVARPPQTPKSSLSESPVDVERVVQILVAMDVAGAPIVAVKRQK